jgi:hypothetical protein
VGDEYSHKLGCRRKEVVIGDIAGRSQRHKHGWRRLNGRQEVEKPRWRETVRKELTEVMEGQCSHGRARRGECETAGRC